MNPITKKVSESMQGLAKGLDDILTELCGERIGFNLIIFTPERASYVSNCDRQQVIAELEHLLSLWKAGMPDVAAHKVN